MPFSWQVDGVTYNVRMMMDEATQFTQARAVKKSPTPADVPYVIEETWIFMGMPLKIPHPRGAKHPRGAAEGVVKGLLSGSSLNSRIWGNVVIIFLRPCQYLMLNIYLECPAATADGGCHVTFKLF